MQEQIIDIHRFKDWHKGELRRVTESSISQNNKNLILGFNRYLALENRSLPRRIKVLSSLKLIAIQLNKDFDKATKEDLMQYVEYLETSDYKEWTKYTFKSILKVFYKWLKGNNESYPEEIRWLKAKRNKTNRLPEELLIKEDVVKLLNSCRSIRDKAFIITLFESGCRIAELGNLKIKNVVFDQYGSVIVVSGKTGMRRVRLIDSTPYLANWVENHPYRDNREKPLWATIKGTEATYAALSKLLRETAERAGVKKRVNPHIFRHSRSTINANFLTEAQMNNYFGWVQGSGMPSIYVHMSGRDVDATIINMHSPDQKIVINKASENNFEPKCCPRCRNNNPATSKFCNRCGAVLELKEGFENE